MSQFDWNLSVSFIISVLASGLSLYLMIYSHVTKKFQYWPPAPGNRRGYYLFWGLGRVAGLGLVVLTYFAYKQSPPHHTNVPIVLFFFGMALTLIGGLDLGVARTKGRETGNLKTTGIYSLSRNPQYIGVFLWIPGWMLFSQNILVNIALGFIAAIYSLCLIMEETWLEEQFGQAYRDYKRAVPRFFPRLRAPK